MLVKYGGRGTPLSVFRAFRMDVILIMTLNLCRSLHLVKPFIPYLLKDEHGGLEFKSFG